MKKIDLIEARKLEKSINLFTSDDSPQKIKEGDFDLVIKNVKSNYSYAFTKAVKELHQNKKLIQSILKQEKEYIEIDPSLIYYVIYDFFIKSNTKLFEFELKAYLKKDNLKIEVYSYSISEYTKGLIIQILKKEMSYKVSVHFKQKKSVKQIAEGYANYIMNLKI